MGDIEFVVPTSLDPINLKDGTMVNVVCEVLVNKQSHLHQYARLSIIGPFDDWEDAVGRTKAFKIFCLDSYNCEI